MKSKEEIKKWLLENCVDENGDLCLIGLDFSDFDGDVYFKGIKVKNDLMLCYQEVKGNLFQDCQQVDGDLIQDGQVVKGCLYQSHQKVEENLYQNWQAVKGILIQAKKEEY